MSKILKEKNEYVAGGPWFVIIGLLSIFGSYHYADTHKMETVPLIDQYQEKYAQQFIENERIKKLEKSDKKVL